MFYISRTDMFFMLVIALVCGAIADTANEFDLSQVIFNGSDREEEACTRVFPLNVTTSTATSTSVDVTWTSPNEEANYQLLYWEAVSSMYSNVSVGAVDQYTLTGLRPFTHYYVSVREECGTQEYGVASDEELLLTRSSFPSEAPSGVKVSDKNSVSGLTNNTITISWSALPEELWNGNVLYYLVIVADITPKYSIQLAINTTRLTIDVVSLMEDHTYLVTVSAVSSGGHGVASLPILHTIDKNQPPTTTSDPEYLNYWYYLAVPAGVLLAIVVTVMIICCKVKYERKKRRVQFVRDISTNISEEKFPVVNEFHRMESTRMSLHNRPLPAYPQEHPRTPSVSSMNARLIDQTSPNQFQRGPSFSNADHHFHHHQYPTAHHHYPPDILPPLELDPNHHQFRNRSLTSPQIPQLSQPISDLSSATPSSVFTESNVPTHPDENVSSPNTPKAYEVPSDSKTCHQSVSPDMIRTNTLPNPHRPHTATGGVMASQPVLSRHPQSSHSPISFTHSSSDVRTGQNVPVLDKPPVVPPHRVNNNTSSAHLQKAMPQQQPSSGGKRDGYPTPPGSAYTQPEASLYSEIPNEQEDSYPRITPPADSIIGHMTGNGSSVVSSDQYSDYSDIPAACDNLPMNDVVHRTTLPLVEEYRNDHRLSSESMSSFSTTESQNSSPSHSKFVADMNHHHNINRMNSANLQQQLHTGSIPEEHDYDEANSVITDNSCGKFSTVNSKSSHVTDVTASESFKPNPYLSPVDIVSPSSNNNHSPPSE